MDRVSVTEKTNLAIIIIFLIDTNEKRVVVTYLKKVKIDEWIVRETEMCYKRLMR